MLLALLAQRLQTGAQAKHISPADIASIEILDSSPSSAQRETIGTYVFEKAYRVRRQVEDMLWTVA